MKGDPDHVSRGFFTFRIISTVDLKHTEQPEGVCWDLHFNLRVSLYSICSYLPTTPGVGGGGGGSSSLWTPEEPFPDCVQTCRDVPPVSLPSAFSH